MEAAGYFAFLVLRWYLESYEGKPMEFWQAIAHPRSHQKMAKIQQVCRYLTFHFGYKFPDFLWDTCLRVWVKYWQAYWEILRIWWEELKLLASLYENSRVTWCSKAFEEDIKNKEAGKREVTEVQHKYERLGPFFFYLCGLMRHMDDSCRILLSLQEDDGTSWAEELLDNKFFSKEMDRVISLFITDFFFRKYTLFPVFSQYIHVHLSL